MGRSFRYDLYGAIHSGLKLNVGQGTDFEWHRADHTADRRILAHFQVPPRTWVESTLTIVVRAILRERSSPGMFGSNVRPAVRGIPITAYFERADGQADTSSQLRNGSLLDTSGVLLLARGTFSGVRPRYPTGRHRFPGEP